MPDVAIQANFHLQSLYNYIFTMSTKQKTNQKRGIGVYDVLHTHKYKKKKKKIIIITVILKNVLALPSFIMAVNGC